MDEKKYIEEQLKNKNDINFGLIRITAELLKSLDPMDRIIVKNGYHEWVKRERKNDKKLLNTIKVRIYNFKRKRKRNEKKRNLHKQDS